MHTQRVFIYKLSQVEVCYSYRNIVKSCQFSTSSSNITRNLISSYCSLDLAKRQQALQEHFIPMHQNLLHSLILSKGSIQLAIRMREDLMNLHQQNSPDAKALDAALKGFLGSAFCPDALELRRITFESSSGNILESVARGEAVHSVRSLSELKRRLHDGRRCFAYFHHSMPNSPLAFIHVSLNKVLAESMSNINTHSTEVEPTYAIFYSVNSPFAALSGLDLPTRLIKDVVSEIKSSFPTVQIFSTLSPIPEFMKWLIDVAPKGALRFPESIESKLLNFIKETRPEDVGKPLILWVANRLQDKSWSINSDEAVALKDAVTWLGCVYLAREKLVSGKIKQPLDPVARFHLRNGAVLHSLNWMANPSTSGLSTSAGMMVNYLYDLDNLQDNAKLYQEGGQIQISDKIRRILSSS